MASELIIIIVGLLSLLIAFGDFISSLNLLSDKFRVTLGIIGLLLIVFGGYTFGTINFQGRMEQYAIGNKLQIDTPIERVQVISPIDGDSVKCRILTMGVYPDSLDRDIWVLLRPSDGKYYPQSDHTNTSYKRDGEWQVITRFGGVKGEIYELNVYATDTNASEFFVSTIERWKDARSYPGLTDSELPNGATLIERVSVPLKDNCRGVF